MGTSPSVGRNLAPEELQGIWVGNQKKPKIQWGEAFFLCSGYCGALGELARELFLGRALGFKGLIPTRGTQKCSFIGDRLGGDRRGAVLR